MPSAPTESSQDLTDLLARVDAEAARLAKRSWRDADNERAAAEFERCAVASLRAPVLAERSIVLRKFAKRVTPDALVPTVKRAVKLADATSRRVVDLLAPRRSRP